MKVICIVQARMGSERLPGKVIKPILDQPMILYTLNRLKRSKYSDQIIVATSDKEQERPLVNVVKSNGFEIFRGSEYNVLKRYVDTCREYGGDIIVRITGDCPLIDPTIVDNVISYYIMYDFDYVRLDVPNTFIRGFDVEVFSNDVLMHTFEEVSSVDNNKKYKEHVTLYIYENPHKFNIGYVKGNKLYNKNYRLCVDTIEDFELIEKILNHFKDPYVPAKNIVKFLDNNLNIAYINKNIHQKKV